MHFDIGHAHSNADKRTVPSLVALAARKLIHTEQRWCTTLEQRVRHGMLPNEVRVRMLLEATSCAPLLHVDVRARTRAAKGWFLRKRPLPSDTAHFNAHNLAATLDTSIEAVTMLIGDTLLLRPRADSRDELTLAQHLANSAPDLAPTTMTQAAASFMVPHFHYVPRTSARVRVCWIETHNNVLRMLVRGDGDNRSEKLSFVVHPGASRSTAFTHLYDYGNDNTWLYWVLDDAIGYHLYVLSAHTSGASSCVMPYVLHTHRPHNEFAPSRARASPYSTLEYAEPLQSLFDTRVLYTAVLVDDEHYDCSTAAAAAAAADWSLPPQALSIAVLPYVGALPSSSAAAHRNVYENLFVTMRYVSDDTPDVHSTTTSATAMATPWYLAAMACVRLADCDSAKTLIERLCVVFEHTNAVLLAYGAHGLCADMTHLELRVRGNDNRAHTRTLYVNVPHEEMLRDGWTHLNARMAHVDASVDSIQ